MISISRFTIVLFVIFLGLIGASPLAAEMINKVDNFIVFVDQSGSMAWAKAEPGNQKFDQAVESIKKFDKTVPQLGYLGGAATFAPYKIISAPEVYKTGSLSNAVEKIDPPFNHFTPLGDGLIGVEPMIGRLHGKTALILYTDGDSNQGTDPVAQAKGLYEKYDPNLCIHLVSYADTTHGENVISQIGALSSCSVVVSGRSLESDAAMKQFVKDVLYDEKQPTPAPKAESKPAPEPVVVAKEVITFNLLFDFDKSEIKEEMIPSLEQAKIILDEGPETNILISGHTDSTGSEKYNQGLSERRANAVKKWLTENGVSAERLLVVGYGETSPKYDNSSKEGRRLNRRVEMQTK